jgi:integrase
MRSGLPDGFHFHDLRHTGNKLAVAAGASTRELMYRMGQSGVRAALIYQHATNDRDCEIALAIDAGLAMRQDLAREWARGVRTGGGGQ